MSEVTVSNEYAQAALSINSLLKSIEMGAVEILTVAVRNGLVAVEPETAFGLSLGVNSRQDFSIPDLRTIERCENTASNEAGCKENEAKEIPLPRKIHDMIHSYEAYSSSSYLRTLSLTYYPITVLAPSLAMVMGVLSQLTRNGSHNESLSDAVSLYSEVVGSFTSAYDLPAAYGLINTLLGTINSIVETIRSDVFFPTPSCGGEEDCERRSDENILGFYLPLHESINHTASRIGSLASDLNALFTRTLYDEHEDLMQKESPAYTGSEAFVSLSAGEKNTSQTKTPKGKGQPAKK